MHETSERARAFVHWCPALAPGGSVMDAIPIAQAIVDAIEMATEPLRTRIEKLESKPPAPEYKGTFRDSTIYEPGDLVTKSGLWLCTQRTAAAPGTAHDCWKLICKQSKDAR